MLLSAIWSAARVSARRLGKTRSGSPGIALLNRPRQAAKKARCFVSALSASTATTAGLFCALAKTAKALWQRQCGGGRFLGFGSEGLSPVTLRCLLIGDGSLLVECGTLLLARGHHIEVVVTTNDSIVDWAQEIGAELVPPGRSSVDCLAGRTFDWIFSIANLSLIPAAVWQSATQGAVNFHDSLLPRYAGLNAPAWALLAGETQHGVTWHAITDRVDEGDIYVQSTFDIDEDETALTLNAKCFEAGIASFVELIEQIEAGSTQRRAQTLDDRTYCARHDRPDAAATLDFTRTTAEVDRIARALNFGQGYLNPLALPKLRTKDGVYFVLGLEKAATITGDMPGTVVASGEDGAVVSTMDGAVRIQALVDCAGTVAEPAVALPLGEKVNPLTDEELIALRAFTAQTAKHEAWFARRLRAGRAPTIYGSLPRSKAAAAELSIVSACRRCQDRRSNPPSRRLRDTSFAWVKRFHCVLAT